MSKWPLRSMLVAGMLSASGACSRDVPRPVEARIEGCSARSKAHSAPNIILLLTNDQPATMLQGMDQTKALLAEQGMTFRNAYVTLPVCCPSRSTILRGQYPHNHGVVLNEGPEGGWPGFHSRNNEASTVATWLQDAGYRTALVGKYLNHYPPQDGSESTAYVPPGWTEWYANLGPKEILASAPAFFEYLANENGAIVGYGAKPTDYSTDVMTRQAASFICRSVHAQQPFFLYLAPDAPHPPATPAPRHQGRFTGTLAPRPPSFNEADVSDKVDDIRLLPFMTDPEITAIDALYGRMLESLQAVDDMVGDIVRLVDQVGALANTWIFYTSDNGLLMGEHRVQAAKGRFFTESIRIPLIVRGPGVPQGTAVDWLVINNDFAPTFAELAGAPIPDFVDGRSLLPLLRGAPPAAGWRKGFLVETYGRGVEMSGLRNGAVLYRNIASGFGEFYDLAADPFELENGFRTLSAGVRGALDTWLMQLRSCAGEQCRAAEDSVLSAR